MGLDLLFRTHKHLPPLLELTASQKRLYAVKQIADAYDTLE